MTGLLNIHFPPPPPTPTQDPKQQGSKSWLGRNSTNDILGWSEPQLLGARESQGCSSCPRPKLTWPPGADARLLGTLRSIPLLPASIPPLLPSHTSSSGKHEVGRADIANHLPHFRFSLSHTHAHTCKGSVRDVCINTGMLCCLGCHGCLDAGVSIFSTFLLVY